MTWLQFDINNSAYQPGNVPNGMTAHKPYMIVFIYVDR